MALWHTLISQSCSLRHISRIYLSLDLDKLLHRQRYLSSTNKLVGAQLGIEAWLGNDSGVEGLNSIGVDAVKSSALRVSAAVVDQVHFCYAAADSTAIRPPIP